jgi:long-subunit acyl-CoA synthetase (AMP-forming)
MEYKSPLDMLYQWEEIHPDKVYLRQPIDDVWHTWTWKQAAEEVRRMATALIAMDLLPHSNIAMISKNCAHWILCDLAIMMSGIFQFRFILILLRHYKADLGTL